MTQPIRRWLQISVCVLMCLSGITFAAAEGRPLALVSVPVALIGLVLTDRRQVFALSGMWANLLGLSAFVAAGYEFFGESVEGRLLGFGHLLLYLAWILLLQRKQAAQFWWLCALSVLQIATSSVLTNDVWFPLVAMGYAMLALGTLSIFSLDRAVARAAGVERSARMAAESDSSPGAADVTGLFSGGVDRRTGSRSRNTVRLESATRWLTPRFVAGILGCGAISVLLGLAIFVLTPRVWAERLHLFEDSLSTTGQPLTGFTEEVKLGDIGEILENPNIVLEVEFFDHRTNKKLGVEETMLSLGYDAPVFRGKVLERYADGRWTTANLRAPDVSPRQISQTELLRQEIKLHPIGTLSLFVADRAMACVAEDDIRILIDRLRDTFTVRPNRRAHAELRSVFSYSALSRPPGSEPSRSRRYHYWAMRTDYTGYESAMLNIPTGLKRLTELAQELARSDDGADLPASEISRRMLHYLRDSGEYGYTLNVAIDDPTIDPVEDFLFNRKQGHCEYFASALALMLRAENIPSRLVSGFKGGALNPATERFEVRQLHAHAWVEAMIDGQWTVLDPTPASRDASVASISTSLSPLRRVQQALEVWWVRGLFLNQSQQQAWIFQPLEDFFRGGVNSVRRVGLFQSVLGWFRELGRNPQQWISGRGFITAFVLGLMISAVVWTLKKLSKLLSRIPIRHRRGTRQQRQMIVFYERFRRLVARQGHLRDNATTHREFALTIEKRWENRGDVDGLAHLPSHMADVFNRVRFGEEVLAAEELRDINASLDRLEQWIARSGHTSVSGFPPSRE